MKIPFHSRPLLSTESCDAIEATLNTTLGEHRTLKPAHPRMGKVVLTGCQLSRIKLFGVEWEREVHIRSTSLTSWHGIRLLSGQVKCNSYGFCAQAGELLIFSPDNEVDLRWRSGTRAVVFSLPASLLAEHLNHYHHAHPLISSEKGWHVRQPHPALMSMGRLQDMISAEIENPASIVTSDVVSPHWQSIFCENLLQMLPELVSDRLPPPLPGMVKRAVDYIDAHLEGPLDMAELVRVSATSRRSLEKAFQHALQTSPVRYHRLRRLEALRDLLKRYTPGEVQLAELAYRWGFAHPSHFTSCYKQAFGELPSDTLVRAPLAVACCSP
jgi:AraC-like DNA-binding protein